MASQQTLRLSVEQYHQMCQSGEIDERTELLSGIVIEKMGKSPLHSWTVRFLYKWLDRQLDTNLHQLRKEEPLTLGNSEPEPDLAIVEGTDDDFHWAHPTSAVFVVEVAISSEDVDRQKAEIYAQAGIAEYWIVYPEKSLVSVHTEPSESGYGQMVDLAADSQLTPISIEAEPLDLAKLFPAQSP